MTGNNKSPKMAGRLWVVGLMRPRCSRLHYRYRYRLSKCSSPGSETTIIVIKVYRLFLRLSYRKTTVRVSISHPNNVCVMCIISNTRTNIVSGIVYISTKNRDGCAFPRLEPEKFRETGGMPSFPPYEKYRVYIFTAISSGLW